MVAAVARTLIDLVICDLRFGLLYILVIMGPLILFMAVLPVLPKCETISGTFKQNDRLSKV